MTQPPQGPQSPQPPSGPQSPQSPAPGHTAPTPGGYGGPVPPGGWQQPLATPPVVQGALAGWGSRVAAYLIDAFIIFVPAIAIMVVLGLGVAASGDSDGGVAAFVGGLILTVLVFVVVAFLYAPLLMMRKGERNGQTIGKQLLNIRVVRDSGQPYNFGSAALREVVIKGLALGIAGSIIPFVPYFLDYFWPLWDDENRALHDMAVSSHVVRA